MVLLLLIIAVFFSISAPDEPWALLATTVVLALTLSIAMWASGVRLLRVSELRNFLDWFLLDLLLS